ncbi:MAG: hypothetical protein AB7N76_30150 [Planctomycetota bacterium]
MIRGPLLLLGASLLLGCPQTPPSVAVTPTVPSVATSSPAPAPADPAVAPSATPSAAPVAPPSVEPVPPPPVEGGDMEDPPAPASTPQPGDEPEPDAGSKSGKGDLGLLDQMDGVQIDKVDSHVGKPKPKEGQATRRGGAGPAPSGEPAPKRPRIPRALGGKLVERRTDGQAFDIAAVQRPDELTIVVLYASWSKPSLEFMQKLEAAVERYHRARLFELDVVAEQSPLTQQFSKRGMRALPHVEVFHGKDPLRMNSDQLLALISQ